MAMLFLLGEGTNGFHNVWDYTDLLIGVLEFFGLFGYVFRFRVFSRGFWKVGLIVSMLYDVITPFFEGYGWGGMIIGWIITFPAYLAIFRYAYRSDPLWERD